MKLMQKAIVSVGFLGSTLLGGIIAANLVTNVSAASTTATASPAASTAAASPAAGGQRPPMGNFDPSKGGHTANGITETLLTGTTADKVRAAALVAVPGGTIERVENDAEGATYEAHMTKADGSEVTVKFDAGFKVTGIETGGPGGPGGPGR